MEMASLFADYLDSRLLVCKTMQSFESELGRSAIQGGDQVPGPTLAPSVNTNGFVSRKEVIVKYSYVLEPSVNENGFVSREEGKVKYNYAKNLLPRRVCFPGQRRCLL